MTSGEKEANIVDISLNGGRAQSGIIKKRITVHVLGPYRESNVTRYFDNLTVARVKSGQFQA